MKIGCVGAEFFYMDGRTDMMQLIVGFHNVANSPKILIMNMSRADNVLVLATAVATYLRMSCLSACCRNAFFCIVNFILYVKLNTSALGENRETEMRVTVRVGDRRFFRNADKLSQYCTASHPGRPKKSHKALKYFRCLF
jgi:hypothetical protein